jgi:hypothetical protein
MSLYKLTIALSEITADGQENPVVLVPSGEFIIPVERFALALTAALCRTATEVEEKLREVAKDIAEVVKDIADGNCPLIGTDQECEDCDRTPHSMAKVLLN